MAETTQTTNLGPEGFENPQAYWRIRNGLADLHQRIQAASNPDQLEPVLSEDLSRRVKALIASLMEALPLDDEQKTRILDQTETDGLPNGLNLIAVLQNLICYNWDLPSVRDFLTAQEDHLTELMGLGKTPPSEKSPEAAVATEALAEPIATISNEVRGVVAASEPEAAPEDPRLKEVEAAFDKLDPEIKMFYPWKRVVEAFGRVNPLNGLPYTNAIENVQKLPHEDLALKLSNGEISIVDGGRDPRVFADPSTLRALGLEPARIERALDSRIPSHSGRTKEVVRSSSNLQILIKGGDIYGATTATSDWIPSQGEMPMRGELRVPLVKTALDGVQRDWVSKFIERTFSKPGALKLSKNMGHELLLDALLGTLQPRQVETMMREESWSQRFALTSSPKPEEEQVVGTPRVHKWTITDTAGEFSPGGEFVDDKDMVKAIVRRRPKEVIEMDADNQRWMWVALDYLTNGNRFSSTPKVDGHQALRTAIVHSLSQEEAALMKKHLAPNPSANCKLTCEKGPAKDGKQMYRWRIYVEGKSKTLRDGSISVTPEMDYHGEFESDS